MSKLVVERYMLGQVQTNCYIIRNEDTKEAVIVDPADNGAYIKSKLDSQGVMPTAVLLTHGHFDHILAVDDLKKTYEIPVIAHEAENEILLDPYKNLSAMLPGGSVTIQADYLAKSDEILSYLNTKIRVIHTPGHTIGGTCYHFVEEKLLFSGDTLFRGSVGRTDFPTGSMSTLVRSIQDKLFVLAEDTLVYPGHEDQTDINRERKFNPYIR